LPAYYKDMLSAINTTHEMGFRVGIVLLAGMEQWKGRDKTGRQLHCRWVSNHRSRYFDPIKQGAYNPADADPAGQTLHGDHAYVFYEVPANVRKLPLIFWHGHGKSAKTWESSPDGREGFQNIFLRRRFPVYMPRNMLRACMKTPCFAKRKLRVCPEGSRK